MKTILVSLSVVFILFSCESGNHVDFSKNVETVKELVNLHALEDADGISALFHDDLEWQGPAYGSGQLNKADHMAAIVMYHNMFDNLKYTANNWLPGVNAETGQLDGSVRTYGVWTGAHTATETPLELTSYHTFDFKDGKIIAGGDYFDLGGMFASFEVALETEQTDAVE